MANRSKTNDFDLIIIGSGSGGGVAAHLMSGSGKKVALIEKSKLGGECINYACIPSKALLESAKIFNILKSAPQFGSRATSYTFNYRSVQAWKDKVVRSGVSDDSRSEFASEGITTFHGRAHFLDSSTITIGETRLSAKSFIIATGSRVAMPPIKGLKEAGFLTFKEAGELKSLPRSIFIIGGGAVACEYAEIFSTFGARVHIAEQAGRLLPKEDPESSAVVEKVFEDKGIHIHTSTQIIEVSGGSGRKTITYIFEGEVKSVTVEEILLAAGKVPSVDLGLDNAGIKYDDRGIKTNSLLQTSKKHIYAIGDVTGISQYTHVANNQAKVAVHNLLHRKKFHANYLASPRVVFVDPEVASVGLTESELERQKIVFQTGYCPIHVVGRSLTTGQEQGFVKIIATHTGVVVGGSIVSLRAGEMIHEIALAVQEGTKANRIANMIHAFPTWSEAIRVAAAQIKCL